MHRELSPRRMKRWLDRRCEHARKGRRMGLAPYRLDAPAAGDVSYIVGERVRVRIQMHALGMTCIRPMVVGVARMLDNYNWACIKASKVELSEESLDDRIQAYRGKQRAAIKERKDAILDEMTARFGHIIRKRPFVTVPR